MIVWLDEGMLGKIHMNRRAARWVLAASSVAAVSNLAALSLLFLKDKGVVTDLDVADWRPTLLIWGVCSLIVSCLLAFQLKKSPASESSSGRLSPGQKILLSVATLSLALAFAFPNLSAALAKSMERQWPSRMSTNAKRATLEISMDCAACARGIESTLRKETLAEKAEADFKKGEVVVWIDPEKTSVSSILETLKGHGFTPTEKK